MSLFLLTLWGAIVSNLLLTVHGAESSAKHDATPTKDSKKTTDEIMSIPAYFPPDDTGIVPGVSLNTATATTTTATVTTPALITATGSLSSSLDYSGASSTSTATQISADPSSAVTTFTNRATGTTTSQPENGNNQGVIIGASIGGTAFVILIAVVVAYLCRRRRKGQFQLVTPPRSFHHQSRGIIPPSSPSVDEDGYKVASSFGTPTPTNFTSNQSSTSRGNSSMFEGYLHRLSTSTYNSDNQLLPLPNMAQLKTASRVSSVTGIIDPSIRDSTTLPPHNDYVSYPH